MVAIGQERRDEMTSSRRRDLWMVSILAIENAAIFWKHYFCGYGFPWDFSCSYFGMNAFSIGALQHGMLPQWMPFQCMGYPYALNLQSGLYYPPLWLFAAFRLPFELHTATILQCLHVLLGAIGMYFLLRRLLDATSYSVVGASMYHFFGGFYGNAQHVDIIRSFAFVPWLFLALTIDESWRVRMSQRLLIPLVVFFAATGGYPGNLISMLFIGSLYVAAQLMNRGAGGWSWRLLPCVAEVGGLVVLGLGLAAIHLAPAWIERAELYASGDRGRYFSLWVEHLAALLFSSTPMTGARSMNSTFLPIPGLLLALFMSRRAIKDHWVWFVVLVGSLAMVTGAKSPLWVALVSVAEPFRLSRFPSSDYRPLIALALVVLSASGLRSLHRGEIGLRSFVVRGVAAFLIVALAGRAMYGGFLEAPVAVGLLVALASLWLVSMMRGLADSRWSAIAVTALVILICLDAFRVLPDMATWHEPSIATLYERRGWVDAASRLRRERMFDEARQPRPARQETAHSGWYSWAGYTEGRFMMADKTPCLLRDANAVFRAPREKAYMSGGWTPLVLPTTVLDAGSGRDAVAAELQSALDAATDAPSGIRQTGYGIDTISYDVTLPSPALVVENEMYFPGWEATLDFPGRRERIRAIPVAGSLRGWVLPRGTYSMTAQFHLRYTGIYRMISLASLAAWILHATVGVWRRRFRPRTADAGPNET